ncbi:MAG: hypothetical protein AAB036_10470 [Elusimicrobiota bacterium]
MESVAVVSLAALVALGLGHKYRELSLLAQTPPPSKVSPKQMGEIRPVRTVDSAIAAYLYNAEVAVEGDKITRLDGLLTALESPEFEGEAIDSVTAESLAKTIVAILDPGGDVAGPDAQTRLRAAGFLAARVPGKTSRDFVLKELESGSNEARAEILKHVGSPLGVRGSSVYAKVKELGDKGLVPDALLPAALRRTGGLKAKESLITLMTQSDNARLISGCAISLQDYRDPELIGVVLERLEQVGMLDSSGRLPWISPALLDAHLQSAGKAQLRRGMVVLAARPALVKKTFPAVEKGLQSPDADTRRYSAIAIKRAVIAKIVDPKKGETLLAGRLQVETEPVLKAELTGGLEGVRGMIEQSPVSPQ